MNDIQNIIDRQLGICCRFSYDNILKRLVVDSEESFYGLQRNNVLPNSDQDPPIFACRFSEASGYENILALANEDGRVAIQDTTTIHSASKLESFQCHNNAVFDLSWMPKNNNFVTVSGDHTVALWDVAESSPKRVILFCNHTRSVKTAVFKPSEPSVFATGARDGHILVWDIRSSNQSPLVLKPDSCLINCHSSFTAKTPGSHSKRPRIDSHRAISITGLVFQDDQTLISCGECDGNIKVWDLRKNYNIYKREPLPKHSIPYCGSSTKNGYTNLIIDEARTRLYASCMDNVIYCFNISTYNSLPEQRYIGHENSTFYIKTNLSPDSMYLVSGSSDKNAYIWNVKYSEPIVKLTGHWAEVTCAAWCRRDNMKIVTCSDDARHKIWRIGREFLVNESQLKGRAEVIPRTDITSLPQWGALDTTPKSVKRKSTLRSGSYCAKRAKSQSSASCTKTKRCLTDLMNTVKDGDDPLDVLAKRLKLDHQGSGDELQPAGMKRRHENEIIHGSPKMSHSESNVLEWTYIPKPGSTFMTPTKNYENRNCKLISPKSFTSIPRSDDTSPNKFRIISFKTPTENLPNYVLTGEAPHLSLMSPLKKKQNTTDWLTLMAREMKGKAPDVVDEPSVTATPSAKESAPPRRNSVSKKPPKACTKKSNTLQNYFSVTVRQ